MMITVHLSGGRKITKDIDKLIFFDFNRQDLAREDIRDGYIIINTNHVVDVRPAEEDEIRHAEIHGW